METFRARLFHGYKILAIVSKKLIFVYIINKVILLKTRTPIKCVDTHTHQACGSMESCMMKMSTIHFMHPLKESVIYDLDKTPAIATVFSNRNDHIVSMKWAIGLRVLKWVISVSWSVYQHLSRPKMNTRFNTPQVVTFFDDTDEMQHFYRDTPYVTMPFPRSWVCVRLFP